MNYRAILIDPGNKNQERPVQLFGNDPATVEDWALKMVGQPGNARP